MFNKRLTRARRRLDLIIVSAEACETSSQLSLENVTEGHRTHGVLRHLEAVTQHEGNIILTVLHKPRIFVLELRAVAPLMANLAAVEAGPVAALAIWLLALPGCVPCFAAIAAQGLTVRS